MDATLDNLSIANLQDRYNLSSRQSVYNRLNALGIKPLKGRVNAIELADMDDLHEKLSSGMALAEAVGVLRPVDSHAGQIGSSSGRLEEAIASRPLGDLPPSPSIAPAIEMIVTLLIDRLAPVLPTRDPLESHAILERACQHGWHLNAKQLAPILGRQRLLKRDYFVHGFRCRLTSRGEWSIEKQAF